jgi:hypothetical protein
MPFPKKGETKDEYIQRFMGSAEAIRDYPDKLQRYAVALSLWKNRNKKKKK